MNTEDKGAKNAFFDKAAFDRVAHEARQRRALFMRKNSSAIVVLGASVTLLCGAGFLIGAATRDTSLTNIDTARAGYEVEASVNAATDQIEKFKSALERASAIAPETASEIEQQINQPVYDCNKMPCSASLQQRNFAVRAQLKALLARKMLAGGSRRASIVHVDNAIK